MGTRTRGQGAIEYLISHGWAILVVLLVGTAMWRLGIFSQDNVSITSMGFTFFKLIDGISESKDGLTVLYFQNTLNQEVTFNTTASKVMDGTSGNVCLEKTISPNPVPAGGQFKVEVMECTPPQQDEFQLNMVFSYNSPLIGGTVAKGEQGTVKGKQTHLYNGTCTKTDLEGFPSYTYHQGIKGITCGNNGCLEDYCTENPISTPAPDSRYIPPSGKGGHLIEFMCMGNQVLYLPIGCTCVDGACQ